MISKMLRAITLTIVLANLAACTQTTLDELDPGGELPSDEEVFYDPDIANIISSNCTTCHGGPSPSAGLNLTTYNNVRFAAETGNLIFRINSVTNPMPPGGQIPALDRQKIQKWADDGFPEN